jgi:hypothetical protein
MTKSATASVVTSSTAAAEKLARQRLSVLELAQTLGSVSAVCRQRGVSRTQFQALRLPEIPGDQRQWSHHPEHPGQTQAGEQIHQSWHQLPMKHTSSIKTM